MQAHLSVKSLSKRFGPSSTVGLENISIDFPSGSKTFLIGANGRGKTTLLKILAGLFRADAGEILFNGQPLRSKSPPPVGLFLGLEFIHPHASVRENLNFSATLFGILPSGPAVAESLQTWDLETLADKTVGALSQGQKARVALARATIHRPRLLLLDEPWNFLDPAGEQLLNRFLENFPGTLIATSPVSEPRPGYFTESVTL